MHLPDYKEARKRDIRPYKRIDFLEKISRIEGIYVPAFYDVSYNNDGTINQISPNNPNSKELLKFLNLAVVL